MKKRATKKRTQRVTIRLYRDADRPACRRLWRQLAEKHAELYSDPSIVRDGIEDYFDDHLEKVGPRRIWVATSGREVVGFVGLVATDQDGEIEPLVIRRGYRGRGIGSRLADAAIKEVRQLGVKYITVKPVARNREAIEFFRKAGFLGWVRSSYS